jgi:hypothetical protein
MQQQQLYHHQMAMQQRPQPGQSPFVGVGQQVINLQTSNNGMPPSQSSSLALNAQQQA